MLGPVVAWGVLYSIFHRRFSIGSENYRFQLLIGIVFVNFFVHATSLMASSLVQNRSLLLDTRVGTEVVFLSYFGQALWKFVIEFGLSMLAIAVFIAIGGFQILVLVPLLCSWFGLTIGVGLLLAVLQVFVADTAHLWNLTGRLFFFVTPVFYALSDVAPTTAFGIYWLNPLTPFVLSAQNILTDNEFSFSLLLHSMILGFAILIGSSFIFINVERAVKVRV